MTEKELRSYINKINQNKYKETIFLRNIGNNVYLAKVWKNKPKKNDNRLELLEPFTIFFIKNSDGLVVGAVLDMENDLHWLILKKYRGQGYLTNAMRKIILPFLCFRLERDEQQISISKNEIGTLNYNNSKKVAKSLGFHPINNEESKFSIDLLNNNFTSEFIQEQNTEFIEEDLKRLQRNFYFHFKNLEMLSNELLMNFGTDKDLSYTLDAIRYFSYKIEDVFFENE